ncbi:MAG: DivIVA domain-containing protein [Bacillota bacterium]|nr:DivIVA domain-containing protein [Bacillota bacterium]
MITAMEIRKQQFSKSLRGYSEEEVKAFMLQIAEEFEALYSENAKQRENIQILEYELDKYRKIESTMNNSLVLAQQTAEAVKLNAAKEAELILEQSKKRIGEILFIYQEVIKRLNIFNVELKSQLTGELELLEKNIKKTEDMSGVFYSKDLMHMVEGLDKIKLEKVDE